jgi:hypothetical protein
LIANLHSNRVAPHGSEEGAVRFASLVCAAVCGALGAAWVMTSGLWMAPFSFGVAGTMEETRAVLPADIGLGGDHDAPTMFDDDDALPTAPDALPQQPGMSVAAWPRATVRSEPATFVHQQGLPVRLASNPAPRPAIGSRTPSGWVIVGQSVEGRPLHLKTLGTGSARTLVVAGLDGEDRIAVNWVDHFVLQLAQSSETLRDYQIQVLRAANPDGLTAKHLENARGVTINRNFPTANYRPAGNPSAGTGPATEPETRVLMRLLYDLRPQRLVHVVAASTPSEAICNGVAQEAAASLQDAAGITIESFDPRQEAGSIEDFATSVLGIEVVTLRLKIGEDWRSAAVVHYPTFVTAAIPLPHRGDWAQARRAKPRATEAFGADDPVSAASPASTTRRNRSGYEELPPPPHKRGR